jgi:DNA-binding LacI/PurR family transcriptional regulator
MEAAELLLDRIAGNSGPTVLRKLLPELRVRESCGFKMLGARSSVK